MKIKTKRKRNNKSTSIEISGFFYVQSPEKHGRIRNGKEPCLLGSNRFHDCIAKSKEPQSNSESKECPRLYTN